MAILDISNFYICGDLVLAVGILNTKKACILADQQSFSNASSIKWAIRNAIGKLWSNRFYQKSIFVFYQFFFHHRCCIYRIAFLQTAEQIPVFCLELFDRHCGIYLFQGKKLLCHWAVPCAHRPWFCLPGKNFGLRMEKSFKACVDFACNGFSHTICYDRFSN